MLSPSGLRIVFFGTPEFAAHTLERLIQAGEKVVGVVTTPDKPQGRGLKLKGSAVKEIALRYGLPVLTPANHRDPEFLASLRELGADIFVVIAYKILPPEVYTMPRLGAFNVHASLLPKFRGAAPINWAIMRGERETGVTTFLLDRNVDTGGMLLSKRVTIGPNETAGELHDALMALGAEAALETLRGLASGTLEAIPQPTVPEGDWAAPKIFPATCEIDFAQPAEHVHDFIRGLSPYPGAVTTLNGVRLKILRTEIDTKPAATLAPGEVEIDPAGRRLFVGTESAPLEVLQLQREGKRSMATEDFLRGDRELRVKD